MGFEILVAVGLLALGYIIGIYTAYPRMSEDEIKGNTSYQRGWKEGYEFCMRANNIKPKK